MATSHGWREEDIATLAAASRDDYYKSFKKTEGPDLHKVIDACLQFDRIVNATEPMREISRRAKEALKRIGQESAINARRVMKYGVRVDAEAASSTQSSPDDPAASGQAYAQD